MIIFKCNTGVLKYLDTEKVQEFGWKLSPRISKAGDTPVVCNLWNYPQS